MRAEAGAALKRLLGDDGSGGALGATHSALDGGWPVLVRAILATPLRLEISHPRSNRTPKCPLPSVPPARRWLAPDQKPLSLAGCSKKTTHKSGNNLLSYSHIIAKNSKKYKINSNQRKLAKNKNKKSCH